MGCDGGSIPRRDELVRVKKKAETKDKDSERHFQWRCCAVTQQPLQEPIVACHLGRLYNKLSLIEALLDKDTLPSNMGYIKNLKDVVTLKLTKNPAFKENDADNCAPYICPVSGLEMSGKFRFVTLWTCGCVFSERVLKEISTKTCHKCLKPFEEKDIVILNPSEEDLKVMRQNMEIRQQMQKKNKEKKYKTKTKESTTTTQSEGDSVSDIKNPASKIIPVTIATTSKMQSSASSTVTSSSKTVQPTSSLKRPGALKEEDERMKKLKPEYSLAKDPHLSDVYKSLFTSHKSEKEQSRAHWVTYNPFYN